MDIDDNILTSHATASSLSALHSNGASTSASSSANALAALTELSEVSVKFFTRDTSLPQVPQTFLNVPVKLARFGLSEIVNALTQCDPPRPFDFLLNGSYIRGDLLRYLKRTHTLIEDGLELEYVEAAPEPESKQSRPHPDWIAALDARGGAGKYVVTACYDSVVRVFDVTKSKQAAEAIGTGHQSAVTCVSVFRKAVKDESASSSATLRIVSGSKDRSVRVWSFTAGSAHLTCLGECIGHQESVAAVATVPGSNVFASGGWDQQVKVWNVMNENTRIASTEQEQQPQKKRKKSDATAAAEAASKPTFSPLATLTGHTGAVSSLVYPHPSSLYSGSYDHTLRLFDIESGTNTSTWYGHQVVTSIDFSLVGNVLGTGHHDKLVRIWDPRQKEKEVMKMSMKSHKGWVSSVKFHPSSPHQLASTSYDSTVKIWDMRASLPLFTLKQHTDKVMTADWMDDNTLWSGGADNKLQTHTMRSS